MGKNLTSRAEDYSKWYNELVVKADLAENSGVRGCMVIKPYGFVIGEKMQQGLDQMFKDTLTKVKYKIEKAGGGIVKLAGDDSGPPPKSGPTPHGLPYVAKNVRPIKERK